MGHKLPQLQPATTEHEPEQGSYTAEGSQQRSLARVRIPIQEMSKINLTCFHIFGCVCKLVGCSLHHLWLRPNLQGSPGQMSTANRGTAVRWQQELRTAAGSCHTARSKEVLQGSLLLA